MISKNLLTNGVDKTGTAVPVFGLPARPGKICIGATPDCRDYCYATRLHFQTKNVVAKYNDNFKQSKKRNFNKRLRAELHVADFNGVNRSRLHPAGDFYSQRYLEAWYDAISRFPGITFTAYTRSYQLSFKDKPKNLNLFYSVDYSTTHFAEDIDRYAYVMPSEDYHAVGRIANTFTCKSKCKMCKACFVPSTKDVLFIRH